MILPWAHRLISAGAHGLRRIPGQSVNLAHLIWRTPRAPAPLLLKEATRCTPGGFPRGAMGVGGQQQKRCHPRRRQPIGDLVPHSPLGSPLCAIASAGMTFLIERGVPSRTPLPQAMPTQWPPPAP